ncbi:MAG TPA: hypothetical protein PKV86_11350, partial [Syntrophobacteraceae bacterium]|nr:hypothetical protein [Syntrophobacteraceae bacterium]
VVDKQYSFQFLLPFRFGLERRKPDGSQGPAFNAQHRSKRVQRRPYPDRHGNNMPPLVRSKTLSSVSAQGSGLLQASWPLERVPKGSFRTALILLSTGSEAAGSGLAAIPQKVKTD